MKSSKIATSLLVLLAAFSLPAFASGDPQTFISVQGSAVLGLDPDSGKVLWDLRDFRWPMEVRVLPYGHLLVCDFGTARVVEIDRKGKIYWQGPGNNPDDARRLSDGTTLIVHNGNSRIGIYDNRGILIGEIREGLDHPTSAFAGPSGSIVIADSYNHRLIEYGKAGRIIREKTIFKKPSSIEPLPDGRILLADLDAHTVSILDAEWEVVWEKKGIFLHPADAKQQRDGHIVVADSGNMRVVELDKAGNVFRQFRFSEKPMSVDIVSDHEWVVALINEEAHTPPKPVMVGSEPISEPETVSRQVPTRFLRWIGWVLLGLLVLSTSVGFTVLKSRASSRVEDTRELTLKALPSWNLRCLIEAFLFIVLNLLFLLIYFGAHSETHVSLLCRGHEIRIRCNGKELGRVSSPEIPSQGYIGLTFWKESINDQACREVIVKDLDSNGTLYRADFTREETLANWKGDPGQWKVDGNRGAVLISRGPSDLELPGHLFGNCSIEFRLRDAAEFSLRVRAQDENNCVRVYLRPQRHLDAWVEVYRNGRKLSGVSRSLEKIVPGFWSQVGILSKTFLKSYFFAWGMILTGTLLLFIFSGSALLFSRACEHVFPEPGGRRIRISFTPSPRKKRLLSTSALLVAVVLSFWMFTQAKWVSERILEKMPHLQDSVSYLFQAKILAHGRLYVESPPFPHRRFFDHEFIVNNGKRFGLQSPGTALLLVPGVLSGYYWLVNPIIGAVSVLVLFLCGRRCYGTALGLLAALLFCASPWVPLMSGTLMAHPAGLLMTLLVIWGLIEGRDGRRWWPFGIAGIGLGFLILLRMGDALAVGVPAILWALVHLGVFYVKGRSGSVVSRNSEKSHEERSPETSPETRESRSSSFSGLFLRYTLMGGICVCAICFLAYYNKQLTGDPFKSTYVAYSPHLRMGFGPDVGVEWGVGHDRIKAITNLRGNLTEFYRYWFSPPNEDGSALSRWIAGILPVWIFAPPFAAFFLKDRKWENLLFLGIILGTGVVYYCYFHSGISYGPRFYYGLVGPLALLTARGCWCLASFPLRIWKRFRPEGPSFRNRFAVVLVTLVFCIPPFFPGSLRAGQRLIQSFRGYNGINGQAIRVVRQANLKNAVVIVRSDKSWFPYGNVFWAMSPELDDDVIFARDEGLHNVPKPGNTPLDNRLLLDLYPDRDYYRLLGTRLVPYDIRHKP